MHALPVGKKRKISGPIIEFFENGGLQAFQGQFVLREHAVRKI
jgi:hypothetical protein